MHDSTDAAAASCVYRWNRWSNRWFKRADTVMDSIVKTRRSRATGRLARKLGEQAIPPAGPQKVPE